MLACMTVMRSVTLRGQLCSILFRGWRGALCPDMRTWEQVQQEGVREEMVHLAAQAQAVDPGDDVHEG